MQNRKRDTDVQNRLLDSAGKGEGGMFRENSIVYYVYIIYMYIRYIYNIMYIYKKHVYYQG